ncbi:hypothetical protein LAZ67_2003695 [Cordylochernes scorpioides]|uniref:SH3 domain-containing protein n=1 Tax=Cordylochernes scorpioides TaxID=51811 RepID=A0ABY6K3D3_9ARAC|nr:hypothetical protein LAZ67_2003695 [Cordylochernes scorpioides]
MVQALLLKLTLDPCGCTEWRRAKALFSYSPKHDDELQLEVGDVIEVMEEVEEGWWRGILKGVIGVFPSNFVAELKDSASPKEIKKSSVREMAVVMHPYTPENDDELALKEGDIITIITKDVVDVGWWKGEINGQVGVFPDNFVQLLPVQECPPTKKPPRTKEESGGKFYNVPSAPTETKLPPPSTSSKASTEPPTKKGKVRRNRLHLTPLPKMGSTMDASEDGQRQEQRNEEIPTSTSTWLSRRCKDDQEQETEEDCPTPTASSTREGRMQRDNQDQDPEKSLPSMPAVHTRYGRAVKIPRRFL